MTTLTERMQQETAAKIARLQAEAGNMERIAAAYDATGYAGKPPHFIHAYDKPQYDDDLGILFFKNAGPDELAALLAALPPIARVEYLDAHRSRCFRPGAAPDKATEVVQCDGVEVGISAYSQSGGTFRVSWSTMLQEGVQVGVRIEPRPLHWLYPWTQRHAVYIAHRFGRSIVHQFVQFEGPTSLVWPEDGKVWNAVRGPASLFTRTYGSTDQSHGDMRIRGRDVGALIRAWEDEANRRHEATKAAFLAAWAGLMPFDGEAITREAERMRAEYETKKGGLRAGTLMQTAALATPHALAERAIAEKHWPAYAEYNKVKASQTYFDHYAWACAYLASIGLYEVPVTDQMREEATGGITKDTYKYGERWL